MISKSLEDAYKDFTMQHKFPFAVLHFHVNGEEIDVNVHPTKMELRFQRQQEVYGTVYEAVHRRLLEPELIQKAEVPDPVASGAETKAGSRAESSSPFLLRPGSRSGLKSGDGTVPAPAASGETKNGEAKREEKQEKKEEKDEIRDEDYFIRKMRERVMAYHNRMSSQEVADRGEMYRPKEQADRIRETVSYGMKPDGQPDTGTDVKAVQPDRQTEAPQLDDRMEGTGKPRQMDLFEENFLKREVRAEYRLIGQVFDTYWLVQFQDSLYIIDQHAAHERVLYERTLKEMKTREYTSQYLSPPIILSLSMQEAQLLNEHMDRFTRIGFEIEPFGGEEFAVRAIPDNLFGIAKKELLMEMIDDLSDGISTNMAPDLIDEKVASMSCKAAVKGNSRLSAQEVDALIGELLTLDNPYHCPHGRPTIIAMTKRELEKKFKRIV